MVAIGLALIYRSTRILNSAHGDLATVGTFIAILFSGMHFPIYRAIVLAMLFGGILAIAFYFGVLIPSQWREATHIGQIVLILAMGLMIQDPVPYFGSTQDSITCATWSQVLIREAIPPQQSCRLVLVLASLGG
jgi:branched-chain amino acid transport system permease protein